MQAPTKLSRKPPKKPVQSQPDPKKSILKRESTVDSTLKPLILGFLTNKGGKIPRSQFMVQMQSVLHGRAFERMKEIINEMKESKDLVEREAHFAIPGEFKSVSLKSLAISFRDAKKKSGAKFETTEYAVLRRLCMKFSPLAVAGMIPRFFLNFPVEKQTAENFEKYVKDNESLREGQVRDRASGASRFSTAREPSRRVRGIDFMRKKKKKKVGKKE